MFRRLKYRFKLTLWKDGFMDKPPLRELTPAQTRWAEIGIWNMEIHANYPQYRAGAPHPNEHEQHSIPDSQFTVNDDDEPDGAVA